MRLEKEHGTLTLSLLHPQRETKSVVSRTPTFLDGYCNTVQGLLDWFEVDLGFTELLFIQIDLCIMSYTRKERQKERLQGVGVRETTDIVSLCGCKRDNVKAPSTTRETLTPTPSPQRSLFRTHTHTHTHTRTSDFIIHMYRCHNLSSSKGFPGQTEMQVIRVLGPIEESFLRPVRVYDKV